MAYPKTYDARNAPVSVRVLLQQVLPRLLEGGDPTLDILRAQLQQATITSVELSGVGFFVRFAIPPGLPTTDPRRIVGGNAEIAVSGVEHGAGCVLFVDDGRLSMFEGFTYGSEEWTEDAEVASIGFVTPLLSAG